MDFKKKKRLKRTRLVSPLLIFIFVILLISTPLVIYRFIKTGQDYAELGNVNRGNEITPASQLNIKLYTNDGMLIPFQFLQGKWGLIYVSPDMCLGTCIENIFKMILIRQALMDNNNPPYIMLISNAKDAAVNPVYKLLEQQYPSLFYVMLPQDELQHFFDNLPNGTQSMNYELLYLVNPETNLIRSYPPNEGIKYILDDLNTLMKTS